MEAGTTHRESRWQPRTVTAGILRALIFAVPIGAGFGVGTMVAAALPQPGTAYEIAFWWIAIVSVATVAATATDRLARQLLPLTVLLRMTMVFPDAAPSRMRIARRAGNVAELRRRIREAEAGPANARLGELAELVLSLSTALSHHDRRTRGHSERTRVYTDLIAEEMGLPAADRDRLRWAALLHDVGKLEVPSEILNKDSSLDDDEWNLVKEHPIHGMRIVAPLIPWLGSWAETIEHHHERFDGAGYPHGLAGADIALGARIVSVADAFDVMTSGRSYQAAMTPAQARAEIIRMAGVQFDPVVARALMNVSLGKLRWTAGPLAAIAQIPFIRGVPQLGRDLAVVLTTSAIVATGFASGVIPTPEGIRATPTQIVEVVIAGDHIRSDESLGRDTSGLLIAAGSPAATPSSTTVPIPTSPNANSDTATTDEDTPVTIEVLTNDDDPDGDLDRSSLSIVRAPSRGHAAVVGDTIRYTPAPDFHGAGSFTYRVCDLGDRCATAQVTVTVLPRNDAPIVGDISATARAGETTVLSLPYSDPDGDALTCTLITPPSAGSARVTPDCVLVFSAPVSAGSTVTLGVGVSDGTAAVISNVTFTIVDPPTGSDTAEGSGEEGTETDRPVAQGDEDDDAQRPTGEVTLQDDRVSVRAGGTVNFSPLANDSGPTHASTLTVSQPNQGSASVLGSSGRVRYVAPPDFTGTVSFSYSVCSTAGSCTSAVVTVDVG